MNPDPNNSFSNVPHGSEGFGTFPQPAEDFGTIPKASERKESHTLTVREVARAFDSAGVPRTERSIINWCQPNRQGIARLDCYFDPNERKYFITLQSAELAIHEEQQRGQRISDQSTPAAGTHAQSEGSNSPRNPASESGVDPDDVKSLRRENMDLTIANRVKDMFIEQLQGERKALLDRALSSSKRIGELEARLLALGEPPDKFPLRDAPHRPESNQGAF